MSIYDKATEEWFGERPGQESTVEQCDQCGLYYKPSLGHKCKMKAGEKTMTNKYVIADYKDVVAYYKVKIKDRRLHFSEKLLLGEVIDALEKQIPKKPIDEYHRTAYCPACGELIVGTYCCPECGQKIDWSDDNDD